MWCGMVWGVCVCVCVCVCRTTYSSPSHELPYGQNEHFGPEVSPEFNHKHSMEISHRIPKISNRSKGGTSRYGPELNGHLL